jgi:ABC-type sulfate transport system substrate-binding protein
MKKAIYAITLVLLGALIIQSVWGAEARPAQLLNASYHVSRELLANVPVFDTSPAVGFSTRPVFRAADRSPNTDRRPAVFCRE